MPCQSRVATAAHLGSSESEGSALGTWRFPFPLHLPAVDMDVFNRPPSVAEDTVAYELYPAATIASEKQAVAALATVIREWVDAQLPVHIWHRDAFELKVVQNPYASEQWMLEGRMRVGDCVDDEWLVVWLLREASRHWDVVVGCVMLAHCPVALYADVTCSAVQRLRHGWRISPHRGRRLPSLLGRAYELRKQGN